MKAELEEQVIALEKELETAADSGLELQRMLHELLSKKEEDDPLTQLQDLQEHLNTQRVANENLTKTLATKEEEVISYTFILILDFSRKFFFF